MTINELYDQVLKAEAKALARKTYKINFEKGIQLSIDHVIRKFLIFGFRSQCITILLGYPEERVQKIEAELRQSGELTT